MSSRIPKWSLLWVQSRTDTELKEAWEIATANAMICGDTCGSASRSFAWSRRAGDVEKEMIHRGLSWLTMVVDKTNNEVRRAA